MRGKEDKTKRAIEVFDSCADWYVETFMDFELYLDTFRLFLDRLPKGGAVLELGCGPGNITKYLISQRIDLLVTGTDLSTEMLKRAKVNVPDARFEVMDCRDLDQRSEVYAGIMVGFCLPYIDEMEVASLFQSAHDRLIPEGVLYLSTMEGDYEHSGWQGPSAGDGPEAFIHYYEASWLEERLERTGFDVIELVRKQYPNPMPHTENDLIIIAKKRG